MPCHGQNSGKTNANKCALHSVVRESVYVYFSFFLGGGG